MKTSDIPCKPDCPRRSIHCHSTCPEYEDFANAKREERERIFAIKKEESLQRYEAIRRKTRGKRR